MNIPLAPLAGERGNGETAAELDVLLPLHNKIKGPSIRVFTDLSCS